MFDLRIIELAKIRFETDEVLVPLMGAGFQIFPFFGSRNPVFPYIAHGMRVKGTDTAVATANYYCDVYDSGTDRARLMQIVARIRVIMQRFIDPAGGGIRFFWRDTIYTTQNETIQKAQILFHVRGVDQDQCY